MSTGPGSSFVLHVTKDNSDHNSEVTVKHVTGPLKAETTGRWYAIEKKQREKY